MSRRTPPVEPPEPADGRSCDGGNCDAPSVGWRWFTDLREWLPVCGRHITAKGVPAEFKRHDPPHPEQNPTDVPPSSAQGATGANR